MISMPSIPDSYFHINFTAPWYQCLNKFELAENIFDKSDEARVSTLLNHCLAKFNTTSQTPLTNFNQLPIKFVAQAALPEGEAYESFIANTGQILTRDNPHDLLNGLIWLNFPRSKAVFNQLHAKDIAQYGIHTARTPLRNALTLFDENGGIVVSTNNALLANLQQFAWADIFIKARQQWLAQSHGIAFFPFGHALLEKLVSPRKNITSHTLLIKVDDGWFDQPIDMQREQLDRSVATIFQQSVSNDVDGKSTGISSKNFQPLPVMGIPSYCAENQQANFYHDRSVFRLPRAIKAPIWQLNQLLNHN